MLLNAILAGHFFCGVRAHSDSQLQRYSTYADIRPARCALRFRHGSELIVSQEYTALLASIPSENFTNIGVRVVVIGCGEWDVIPFYKGVGNMPSTSPFQTPPPD